MMTTAMLHYEIHCQDCGTLLALDEVELGLNERYCPLADTCACASDKPGYSPRQHTTVKIKAIEREAVGRRPECYACGAALEDLKYPPGSPVCPSCGDNPLPPVGTDE